MTNQPDTTKPMREERITTARKVAVECENSLVLAQWLHDSLDEIERLKNALKSEKESVILLSTSLKQGERVFNQLMDSKEALERENQELRESLAIEEGRLIVPDGPEDLSKVTAETKG